MCVKYKTIACVKYFLFLSVRLLDSLPFVVVFGVDCAFLVKGFCVF